MTRDADAMPGADLFRRTRRRRLPPIHGWSVLAVGAGGFAGGLARYAVGSAWPEASTAFPWPTFAINTSGAFLLGLLLVLVLEVVLPRWWVRPALGTGLLGAYTTFSSVVVAVDQLAAHGRGGLAAAYLALSLFGGLIAAAAGLLLGRRIVTARRGQEG